MKALSLSPATTQKQYVKGLEIGLKALKRANRWEVWGTLLPRVDEYYGTIRKYVMASERIGGVRCEAAEDLKAKITQIGRRAVHRACPRPEITDFTLEGRDLRPRLIPSSEDLA